MQIEPILIPKRKRK